jgi:Copper transport outer membrane protein, MctB
VLDFRYHVTSLAAVFFALVIGIVLGVGISGRGFVDKSERQKLENRIDRVQARLDAVSADNEALREQQRVGRVFMTGAYPVLMRKRLEAKAVAVVVIGAAPGATGSDVQQALTDAGASVSRYRALMLPVQTKAVRRALAHVPGFRKLEDAGRELAQEWVTGGRTPVADALTDVVVEEQRGAAAKPVDGVVVIQSEQPRDRSSQRFVDGLYGGLATAGIPVVGVETTGAEPSSIDVFDSHGGFSTVDDVDTPSGRLALALLLGGATPGNFGVKTTADAPLPPIVEQTTSG